MASAVTTSDRALLALVAAILERRTLAATPGLDPARVRRHLLAPLAYQAGIKDFKPDYIAAALHAERRAGFLAEAVGALHGIPIMRLKGIAYIDDLYEDPALRPMTDIDLMVPAGRFADAADRLKALGYHDDGKRNQRSPVNHAVTFRRRESAIDLHRSMVQAGRMRIDLDQIWRDAIPAALGTLRPRPLHEYLIHLAHMARHEFSLALISFVDADRLAALAGPTDTLAAVWGLRRADRLVRGYVEALRGEHFSSFKVFPDTHELIRGALPGRGLQVLRKLAIHDSPRDLPGLAWGAIRTRLGL
ncbi:MAG: nucleotidyltransferase family protein [Myxococcales bacterium]|nr:nucleotidyltransferase family protein [Myxococcales bacterium]